MEFMTGNISDKELYEIVTWATIVYISCVMWFLAYLFARLSVLPKRREWRWVFQSGAGICFAVGLIRFAVAMLYFDNYTAKLVFPAVAFLSWTAIGIFGYLAVRYIESTVLRLASTKENIALTEEVFTEVVRPLIQGEPVSRQSIRNYKAQSMALSAK